MAVVLVTAVDPGQTVQRWKVPEEPVLNSTPIPRGLRQYSGVVPIAALGAGDETNVVIVLTFPSLFSYMLKSVTIQFVSDDLTTEFQNIGVLEYRPGGVGGLALGNVEDYELRCDAAAMHGATRSMQNYRPEGTWRTWIDGPRADTVGMLLSDISGDASTAGDVAWHVDALEYDVEQCFNWPVNTPLPTLVF